MKKEKVEEKETVAIENEAVETQIASDSLRPGPPLKSGGFFIVKILEK